MIPEQIKEASVLRLVSSTVGSKTTLVHPISNEPISLWIYSSPAITVPGIFVRDAQCMGRIESLVRNSGAESPRFSLVVRV
jgi:hypothetical protein